MAAKTFQDAEKKQEGKDASSTTCDLEHPHYHISSAHFEHHPEDKIVGVHNWVWIGPVPILYSPYYVYNMKRAQTPSLQFGETDTEGRFVKSSLDYYLGAAVGGGLLFLDSFSKKGFGGGFQHDYAMGESQSGKLLLYRLDEQDTKTTDWVWKLDHKLTLARGSMEAQIKYDTFDTYAIPTGRRNNSDFNLTFGRKGNPWPFNFGISRFDDRFSNFERGGGQFSFSPPGQSIHYSFTGNRNRVSPLRQQFQEQFRLTAPLLTNMLQFRLEASHTQTQPAENTPIDEQVYPTLALQYQHPNYTVDIQQREFYRLREDQFPNRLSDQFTKDLPSVRMRSRSIQNRFFTMTPRIGYGTFREAKFFTSLGRVRDFETGRWEVGTDFQRTDPLPLNNQFQTSFDINQHLYNPGDANYTLSESFTLSSQPIGAMRNRAQYRRGFSEGNSPFSFDLFSSLYEEATDQLDFLFWSAATLTFNAGRNIRAKKWQDVLAALVLTPSPRFNATLRTSYSLEEQKYRDLTANSTITPFDNLKLTLSLVQDLSNGKLKGGNSLLEYEILPDTWEGRAKFRVGHSYDPQTQEYKMRDVEIVKDLHCWELKYTYSDFKKSSNYIFVLKAFPTQPIGVGGEKGLYFEGVEKELEKGKTQQRY